MGDMAKGVKSFKKGLAEDEDEAKPLDKPGLASERVDEKSKAT